MVVDAELDWREWTDQQDKRREAVTLRARHKVASRWSMTARQTADFNGVPSRGRTAPVTGTFIDFIRGDKIVEHWSEMSLPQFVQALGAEQTLDVLPHLLSRSDRHLVTGRAALAPRGLRDRAADARLLEQFVRETIQPTADTNRR